MSICINSFVKRQVIKSEFSHFESLEFPRDQKKSWEELLEIVEKSFMEHSTNKTLKPGYRSGVVLVPVEPVGFYSGVIKLVEGMQLRGSYKPRKNGEVPRKSLQAVGGQKIRAQSVDIVLYASSVLAEDDSNELPPVEGNWEIISINASPDKEEMPINPSVLMHNHFGSSGGTATRLSDKDFVSMLRDSFDYWKNKAVCASSRNQSE